MNHLSDSTSPYLLQHAHNPVDWYPWGAEALQKAKSADKPIFLSIGYAACHWCHVMAHESFEDQATAALMNEHFVCIKVDREERPDIDSIYMAATTSLTGSGGWPMSIFLTPGLEPFYAGTYFPPVPRYNMPSFRDVLSSVARAWTEERADVDRISAQIAEHIRRQASWSDQGLTFSQDLLSGAAKYLHDSYDFGFGGWGQAPKFPQAMTIEFLLRRHLAGDGDALQPALHALQAMARGGMYDVVGGGFSRYSTDNLWRIPHFEKMLYDNAQLARAYLHAWQLTGESFYRHIVEQTLDFVLRELTAPEGGFYSSLDADSEGEEGKFYAWTLDQIREALGEDADFFAAAYGITPRGNWEGRTVLQRAIDNPALSGRFPEPGPVDERLGRCHARLLAVRAARVRPATDDKILAGWNGLMLSAFAEAARVLGKEPGPGEHTGSPLRYLKAAIRSAEFLLAELHPAGSLRRAWRAGKASQEVFLEDYAAVINGLLDLYQTDFNNRWFEAAQELADEMVAGFTDANGGFFDTPAGGEALLLRPKDLQDNATPSGSSLAVEALLRLAAFTDRADYRTLAEGSFAAVAELALRYPTSFAHWLCAADFALAPVKQVAIVGELSDARVRSLLEVVRLGFRPNLVIAACPYPPAGSAPALLHDRPPVKDKPAAYVCQGFVCRMPVTTAKQLAGQL